MTAVSDSPPVIEGLKYVRPLGAGGYSDVYLYEQEMPHRNVAVKVLKNVGLTETIRRQFTAEANAMAKVADHPNIVPVLTANVADDGRPYLVMTFYANDNLGVRAARERFALSEVLRIGIQIGGAVETAHHAEILHRDIKPANILTNRAGTVGLTDFGIAQVAAADDDDDDTGVSVPWSPPEVLYGTAPASVQSDVYSLAATLWHLLAGHSPFELADGDNSNLALMRRARDARVPSTGRPDVPQSLERLLSQAMSKDAVARPSSALDFARSLQAVEQELRLPRTDVVVLTDEPSEPRQVKTVAADVNATRMRAPVRVDAQPVAAPAPSKEQPSFAPSRPSRLSEAEAPVERTINRRGIKSEPTPTSVQPVGAEPREVRGAVIAPPVGAPTDRPRVDEPDARNAVTADDRRGTRRIVVVAAVCAVVALAVLVGVLASGGHSKGKASADVPATTQVESSADAIGPPGAPTITGKRLDANTLEFSWTYSNRADSDSFQWQFPDGSKQGTTATPTLDLANTDGTQVCIQVKVVRADGTNAALNWSDKGCVG